MKTFKTKLLHNQLFLLLSAISTSLCFIMNLSVSDTAESGISNSVYLLIYKLLETMQLDLADHGFSFTIFTILFFFLYKIFWYNSSKTPIKFSRLLALFLSIGYTAGIGFSYDNTLSILITSNIRLIKTTFWLFGMYMLYLTAINLFYDLCNGNYKWKFKDNKLSMLISQKTCFICWIIIFISWFIHIILRYPGTMSYDNYNQLAYYFNYQTFTTAQPIFHTWLFGSFVRLGLLFGSENLGLFLFILFQSLIMSLVLAHSLSLMKKFKTPDWLFYITLGIYCIAPYYSGYASFPVKDYLYTAFFVLLILLLIEWSYNISMLYQGKARCICWIAASTLLILCRNNGVYIYLPLIFMMSIILLRQSTTLKDRKKLLSITLISFILPLILSSVITNTISMAYNVEKDSPKEMFSLPFQQTARYIRDYGHEVTEEEQLIISEVLDYENLPSLYNEMTSDPVKTTYHASDMSELLAYFKVWFRQFLKHPICYIEATWNQNYYVFAPNIDNIVYNKDCRIGHEIMYDCGLLEDINFQVPPFMHGICTIMVSFYSFLTKLPIIGLLNNVAFYIILMFTIIFFMLKDKCKAGYVVLLPLLLAFVFIILSPQIQNQPRYAFPIIYSMPSVTAFYIYIKNK